MKQSEANSDGGASSPAQASNGRAPEAGDMNAEEFRRYGREVVDFIAEYFSHLEERPV